MQLPRNRRDQILLLLLLGLVFIGTGIGMRDPWPSDEPRFALIARDMVDSGQWFFPRRGGELYPDKPPLFMWSQAVAYQVTGSLRFAFPLPSLLAGLFTLLIVYDAGRRLWNRRVGLSAALLLLVTPQFVLEARAGQLDAMVMAWIALGMYGFLRHLLDGPDQRWLMVGFAACGFGIITKGVGFLPMLVFLPWLVARRRAGLPPRGAWWHGPAGVGVMLAAVATWLVPMLLLVASSGDPAFEAYRDNILFKQTGERYVAPSHHFKPVWYFLVNVIPALWLPVFLLLPWAIPAWWRRIRRGDARITLLLGWVLLVVLFFTLSPAKRGVYILPALPWACLAVAPLLSGLVRRPDVRRLAWAGALSGGGAVSLYGAYLAWIRPEKNAELISRFAVDLTPPLLGVGALLLVLAAITYRRPIASYGLMMGVLWVAMGLWVAPLADATRSGRALMEKVETHMPAGVPLALVDWKEQTLLQARRPAENFGFLEPVEAQARSGAAWLNKHPDGRLLVQGRAMVPCFDTQAALLVGMAHRRDWYLVGIEAVLPDCQGAR